MIVSPDPIVAPLLPTDPEAGAVVVFEGWVRNQNEGREVQALEYEAHGPLASAEGERILAEAKDRFSIIAAAVRHRTGLLQIGEVAIRAEVVAPHRRDAFDACEFIVDEVKRRVPIWKKEHYAEGTSEWLNAGGIYHVTEEAFYDRQARLPEVGVEGQQGLRVSRVLVIGVGGLGNPAVTYLAAAGVGTVGIMDGDRVDVSNLHRQPLFRATDVGSGKARLAAERLRNQNPFVQVEIHPERLTSQNAQEILLAYDVIVDATDNFRTKFLLNDLCLRLGRTLVVASVHQLEGQLLVVQPGGPCLRCLWPETPEEDSVGTCAENGVLGFVPGVLGTLQAAEVVKFLLGLPTLAGELALVDLTHLSIRRLRLPRREDCPGCRALVLSLQPHETETLQPGDLLVDIREWYEIHATPVAGAVPIPLSTFRGDEPELAHEGRIVLVCERGVRTDMLARRLRAMGDLRYVSLIGGRHSLLP